MMGPGSSVVAEVADILTDLAPELAMRWSSRAVDIDGNNAVNPALCRGLISHALRSASQPDCERALDVVRSMVPKMRTDPLQLLGFSFVTVEKFLEVLYDLVHCAVLRMPLEQANAALKFYNTAGVGAADEGEFGNVPTGDVPLEFWTRGQPPSLAIARSDNLRRTLECFTAVFKRAAELREDCSAPSPILGVIRRGDAAPLWKLFYDLLPSQLEKSDYQYVESIAELYGALIVCEPNAGQALAVDELHTVLERLCSRTGSSALHAFSQMISPPHVAIRACLKCLTSFDDEGPSECLLAYRQSRPMTIDNYTNKLLVPLRKRNKGARARTALPALLMTIGNAWLTIGSNSQFRSARGTRLLLESRLAIQAFKKDAAGMVCEDVTSFGVTLNQICLRMVFASGLSEDDRGGNLKGVKSARARLAARKAAAPLRDWKQIGSNNPR